MYAARSVLRMPISTTSGHLLQRLEHTAARVPGLFAAMFAAVSRSKRVRRATGTVQATAIGMLLAEQVSRSRRLPSRRARSSLVLHDVCPAAMVRPRPVALEPEHRPVDSHVING
jgi:hypothetical protein